MTTKAPWSSWPHCAKTQWYDGPPSHSLAPGVNPQCRQICPSNEQVRWPENEFCKCQMSQAPSKMPKGSTAKPTFLISATQNYDYRGGKHPVPWCTPGTQCINNACIPVPTSCPTVKPKKGLSGGAIAGIVIGIIVFLILIFFVRI